MLKQKTVYFREEDVPAWDSVVNKAEFLHIILSGNIETWQTSGANIAGDMSGVISAPPSELGTKKDAHKPSTKLDKRQWCKVHGMDKSQCKLMKH